MSPNDLRAEAPLDPSRQRRKGKAEPARPAPAAEDGLPPDRPRREAPERKKRRRRGFGLFKLAFIVLLAGGLVAAVAGYGLYRQVAEDLPDYRWLADYEPPQMSRIYAADSRLTAELATERRVFVPIEAIPQRVQQAFVSAEDQRFWDHAGVDPLGIGRSVLTAIENYGSGRRMGGASTITQQVAKNMLVGNERSMMRKVREAILAVRIEQALSKDRILELYLNEIFLGQSAYGVAAAAQAYFNKGLDELTTAEAAFLAALPKAPNNYNPVRFPEAARARRDWVLDRMAEDGYITREEARYAKAEPIVPRPSRRPDIIAVGQHFTEEVRRELVQRYGAEQTTMGGLVVRTSLDPALQAATERALRDGLVSYDRRRGGWRGAFGQIAAGPTEWMPALEAYQRPPGGLPEWRLAVVLEVRNTEARLGWIERGEARGAPQPRTGLMYLQDLAWARTARDGRIVGGQPSRMNQVVNVGDVVFVEPMPTQLAAQNRPARPERLELRQMPQAEGAVVALDPQTGRVMAMAGGWSFERSWFNRATQAMRQPGSSFKPFVYITALEQGMPPNTELLDEPIEVMSGGRLWRPQNYTAGRSYGWVTMRQAMERSLNLVTVRLAQQVGMDAVADSAARFGVIPNMPRYLAMSLGAGETTVMRMAAGYAAFVNGGVEVTPTLIDSVQDRRGRVVWRADRRTCAGCSGGPDGQPPELVDPQRRQVTDPIAAYQMVSLLQGVVARGTGQPAIGDRLGRPVAGKTGTTDDYKDNWFVGFTPDIVVAVWIGFDEPRSLGNGETGGGNAAPIFREVVAAALRDSPPVPFRAPPGVALVRLNVGNGSILEAFRPGTENSARRMRDGEEGGGASATGLDSNLGGLY
ncbi:penicillin-binding protein 1A [Neoroseomonas oryzicola]|uniref:Penicillin-binding protein 1A n=1 Tax=Neoroseomonas oryzicola TaxID=535904 RepID=A0A9X9WQC2_9PROT|nr:PBP1A family penicillin-binding protein [Neoroseomonas oryzicola]MBR0662532.1 PBP1A family penicillin-binding protein [Neoroseomonas oryzicola]NKE16113.1 PBP1A family penicillin-binding protein [Neoroseomonas oryzicola]